MKFPVVRKQFRLPSFLSWGFTPSPIWVLAAVGLAGCASVSHSHPVSGLRSSVSKISIIDERFFCVVQQNATQKQKRLLCVDKTRPVSEQQIAIEQTYIRDNLAQLGVQIIQQGVRLQMILPVDAFFIPNTMQIIDERENALNEAGLYLRNYIQLHGVHYPVKVYGYSDKTDVWNRRRISSQQHAQVIASTLWNAGFSPSQLRVVGYGDRFSIANFRTPDGNAWNRRVVIQVN